jgi:hypothetical protein
LFHLFQHKQAASPLHPAPSEAIPGSKPSAARRRTPGTSGLFGYNLVEFQLQICINLAMRCNFLTDPAPLLKKIPAFDLKVENFRDSRRNDLAK